MKFPVTVGNGAQVYATKIGKKPVCIQHCDGTKLNITLHEYQYVPKLTSNLFSITKALKQGWKLGNEGIKITLHKSKKKISFDRTLKTMSGFVQGVEVIPRHGEKLNLTLNTQKGITADKLHRILGHPSEQVLRNTAKYYGIKVNGELSTCEPCALGKSRQRNVNKVSTVTSDPGERIYLDISYINKKSLGGSNYWLLLLDDNTDHGWSYFLKRKSDMAEKVIPWIKEMRSKKHGRVKYIRCDNAGENKVLEEMCKHEGLGVTFEYTSPNSPQYNGKIERKFQTLYSRIRTNFNGAGVHGELRGLLWAECARHSQDQDNILVKQNRSEPSTKSVFGTVFHGWEYMREFGEIGIVNYGSTSKKSAKHLNRGRPCFLLGRAVQSPKDTYRFLNLETYKIISSRDVNWLNVTYGEYKERSKNRVEQDKQVNFKDDVEILFIEEDDDDNKENDNLMNNPFAVLYDEDDEEIEFEEDDEVPIDELNEDEESMDPEDNGTGVRKLSRELKALEQQWYPTTEHLGRTRSQTQQLQMNNDHEQDESIVEFENDDESNDGEDISESEVSHLVKETLERPKLKPILKKGNYSLNVIETMTDSQNYESMKPEDYKHKIKLPQNFQQAYNHPNEWIRSKWREAIKKEFDKLEEHQVWKVIKRETIPEGRRCVKHKWVFVIKRDGTFRARLVACGYSQIPGIDFSEVYSPVVNDVTVRILVILILVSKFHYMIVDVQSAFLHGKLDEKESIYMDCPDGMENVDKTHALKLIKSLYGLVQSPRVYFRTFKEAMKKIGFKTSEMDPCLFIRNGKKNLVYMAIWVDDCLIVGTKEDVDETIELFKQQFKTTEESTLNDYLSCEIILNKEKGTGWMGQPDMMKKLEEKFGEWTKDVRKARTPGPPNMKVNRPKEGEERLNDEDQRRYRSGVGALLYLVKYSRPDITNAVRELSKCMSDANREAEKMLKRVLKFVLDTKNYGLKLEPTMSTKDWKQCEWDLVVYSDADWAGDKVSRTSITGFIIFLLGCAISWKSKQQSSISLSSAESEFYALSEAAREIRFVVQLLYTMKIKVRTPVMCRIDNVGAMFMAENSSTSQRSKHVDIRARFVMKMVEDKDLEIIFVKSADNLADSFTKNVSEKIFETHTGVFVGKREGNE